MISIKNKQAIVKMRIAGEKLADIFERLSVLIIPGVNSLEIDSWITKQLHNAELTPRSIGYRGYQHASCISVNDEIIHGVPASNKILKENDLVKVDVCASWKGYCADMARCFFVGNPGSVGYKLACVAKLALDHGITFAKAGNRLTDISWAIQKEVESNGYSVIRDFAGHGIGKLMHEDPEIPNYGDPGHGPLLREGMTFAIEPMIVQGDHKVYVDDDGWTVKTVDKSLAAHIEDTVVITTNGPEIITRL